MQVLSEGVVPHSPSLSLDSQLQKRTNAARMGQQSHLRLLKCLSSRLAHRTQDSLESSEAQSLGECGSGSHEATSVFLVCGLRPSIPNGVL